MVSPRLALLACDRAFGGGITGIVGEQQEGGVPGGSPEFVPQPLWEAGIHGSVLPFYLQNKGRLEAWSPVGLHCCLEERTQECFGKGVRKLECGEEVGFLPRVCKAGRGVDSQVGPGVGGGDGCDSKTKARDIKLTFLSGHVVT